MVSQLLMWIFSRPRGRSTFSSIPPDPKILSSNHLLKISYSGNKGYTYRTISIEFRSPFWVIINTRNFTQTLTFHTLKQPDTLRHFLLPTDWTKWNTKCLVTSGCSRFNSDPSGTSLHSGRAHWEMLFWFRLIPWSGSVTNGSPPPPSLPVWLHLYSRILNTLTEEEIWHCMKENRGGDPS
jgi:hypothetical protein